MSDLDVIIPWPNRDFPVCRNSLRNDHKRYNRILIPFTEQGEDTDFVRSELQKIPNVICTDPGMIGEWRDAATNSALDLSTAEWVWFTEQDFELYRPHTFWKTVDWYRSTSGYKVLGLWQENGRWNPCSLFCRRTAIESTHRYFGPVPVDHFARFSAELPLGVDLTEQLGDAWHHMQGLTQNHYLIDQGKPDEVFKPEDLCFYFEHGLTLGPSPRWRTQAEEFVKWYGDPL